MKGSRQSSNRRPPDYFFRLAAALGMSFTLAASLSVEAGDILRGGAPAGSRDRNASFGTDSAATNEARGNAKDALARTTQAVNAVKAMQDAARSIALTRSSATGLDPNHPGQSLPHVPNGLKRGGLQVAPGVPVNLSAPGPGEDRTLWQGANLPKEGKLGSRTLVTIEQTAQQAVLNWKTFNIGKDTTLRFNQSRGGSRQSDWIAFNKVNDPSGVPSRILGSMEAPGQVYVINQNGIIFGGSSQVSMRTLVASSLPINDNLIQKGLLNNRDAQFLFSSLPVPGGSDGTPAFNPTISDRAFLVSAGAETYTLGEPVALTKANAPLRTPEFTFKAADGSKIKLVSGTDYTLAVDAATKKVTATFTAAGLGKVGVAPVTVLYTPVAVKSGDVTVQAGARLNTLATGDGSGGRIMLVGANVTNAGTLSTPSGQTILAAGQQVAVAAHASDDPSLRGLDVWVGAAADKTGVAANSGLIEAFTGSVWMAGREVNQAGVIESSTSVDLNGRIDLRASYGAVANLNFDNDGGGAGGPPFLFQNTGVVTLGPGSVTRILPDYASDRTVPGSTLPERSQINVEGLGVHFEQGALMLAPNADVTIRAGIWPYKDADGSRTTFRENTEGALVAEPGLQFYFNGRDQRFLFSGGQIYLDPTSMLNVAGSTDVFVPLAHSILNVEFRGSEFADSPVQRDGLLRAVPLTVDIRRTGASNGRFWMGTALGDVTGLAGLIERNVAQLTAEGGNVTMQAGGSIVIAGGATVDVSGGFFQHEAGMVKTTRLLQYGRLVDIANALPGQVYDGVYTGQFTTSSARWGVSETFTVPWMTGERWEQSYIQGAAGGDLKMTAPSMALDGKLLGLTVEPPRGRASSPEHSSLSIAFAAEKILTTGTDTLNCITISPTPPEVTFSRATPQAPVEAFQMVGGAPVALNEARVAAVVLSPALLEEQGFGHLSVDNPDGNIVVPAKVSLSAAPLGSISLAGANVTIRGDVTAPGGDLAIKAYNISPSFAAEFPLVNQAGALAPLPNAGRGLVTLGTGASLNAAGLIVDDRPGSPAPLSSPLAINGGNISIEAYSAILAQGSTIDVSGGAAVSARGTVSYGNGGSITIRTGKDLSLGTVIGGELELKSTLAAYSGATGGSLTLQASLIQIGGVAQFPNTLLLQPDFFRQGGFTSYALTGIGAVSDEPVGPGEPETYAPAIAIAPGTRIEPVAESWLAVPHLSGSQGVVLRRTLDPAALRSPVSIAFAALGSDDPFTLDKLEVRGDIVMGAGAQIVTDPGANVAFDGQTVTLLGSVTAPGGSITVKGAGKFPLPPDVLLQAAFARPTVHIGPHATLSTAGTAVIVPDAFGRRLGTLFAGGTISVSGNILAEAGAVLDVSGATGIFDIHPSALGGVETVSVPVNSGLNSPLWRLRTVPTQMDSNGGLIDLQGSEMLFTDATLLGRAGGPTAIGGTLSIFSGRFYVSGASRTSADINLVVTQDGRTIAAANRNPGVGIAVRDAAGVTMKGMGYFAANRFMDGGFNSLDLGAKYLESASPIPFGGNVQFKGPVSIAARGYLRVAGGGVIEADSSVKLTAPYVAIGQPFRSPLHPDDPFTLFYQSPAEPNAEFNFAPIFGPGSLTVQAEFIDTGTVSLQNIGRASLLAEGDIRGNGTFNIAGDLVLRAGQIYPTTAGNFTIVAYDKNVLVAASSNGNTQVTLASAVLPPGFRVGSSLLGSTVQSIAGTVVTLAAGANATIANKPVAFAAGSVTIASSGNPAAPLSAGGELSIFASKITQGGNLRAPFGSITLGWDGTDFDPTDADLDQPLDRIVRGTIALPTARQVTLLNGSLTSVAGVDGGAEMLIPYGLSPDGLSWIDPRGVNVTINGLPQKNVSIAGDNVTTERGSVVDIRGGGDLFAFRWVPGSGGSADILGTATANWGVGTTYAPGDLVRFGGKTYSARVGHAGEKPSISLFWSVVAESYAVLPGFQSEVAPFAPFNAGANSGALSGEPGFVSSKVKVGDRVFLEGSEGLNAGVYTLLPRRYALLPGAFIVTPSSGEPLGTIGLPEGSSYVAGYTLNTLNSPQQFATVRTRFEVAPTEVVRGRARYEDYFANDFMREAATRLDIESTQRLPIDSGYLAFHGNAGLRPEGMVLTGRPSGGRGAAIDLSSFADIYIVGGSGSAPANATAILHTEVLKSWGAESLLIGGLRRRGAEGTVVDVRTSNLFLDNPGGSFFAPEITLVSKGGLTLTAGSSIFAKGRLSEPAASFLISGDGTLLRVSGDLSATVTRSKLTGSTLPLMTIGAGVTIAGGNVILDSTYGTLLDPTTVLHARALTLGSGQISILLKTPPGGLVGSLVDPHLTLSGEVLESVQQVGALTLRSYRTIDFYGAGTFGGDSLGTLSLLASGIRGFDQGLGTTAIQAGSVLFSNPSDVAQPAAPAATSGTFQVDARSIRFGEHTFSVTGYENVVLNAARGVRGQGSGAFITPGNLTINTPVITGTQGSTHAIAAGGALVLESGGAAAGSSGGLGSSFTFTGTSIVANTSILLPSGQLTLRATTGDVTVGGNLDVSGAMREFYDLIRYTDGGSITIASDAGDVELLAGSRVSVAAPAGGGNAGSVSIKAAQGAFSSTDAILLGGAGAGRKSGSFLLDVKTLTSFTDLSTALNVGGFFEQRNLRVRTGDIMIANAGGLANVTRNFTVSADTGEIRVTGTIDASGVTGGRIVLVAGGCLVLESGSILTAHGEVFSSAGKGGEIRLEAGAAVDGVANLAAILDVQAGSTIDLGVDAFVAGTFATPGSSAFGGQFTGTLHLRAPRSGSDVNVNGLAGTITGASSVLVEGYRIYDRTGIGTMNIALRELMNADSTAYINAGYAAMETKLLAGSTLDPSLLVIAPGVEIINRTGNLTLGVANPTAAGSTSAEARSTADWDLSAFRYGPKGAAGVLTLRASGDLIFNNTLSDGFTPVTASGPNGHSAMWLAELMDAKTTLPTNTQSWSYRLAAGSDLRAADFHAVVPNAGSLLVGEFYPAVPNTGTSGASAAIGNSGLTANTIRISTNVSLDRGTRFEVIRTGTGDIDIAAGKDVQLRNQFATIYTAGVRLPNPNTIFTTDDFVLPSVEQTPLGHPSQGGALGAIQQRYHPQWSMAGGDVTIAAHGDIGRFTLRNGLVIADASRQMPNNWLYRRGYVDPATGLFAVGGVDSIVPVIDPSASTTWWIDFSNFFQGFGTLGGGDIMLAAGRDLVNADAVIPTNARMPGRVQNADLTFTNVAPDPAKLVELGGGDLVLRAGNNIDGGVFYAERGKGTLSAGGSLTTNAARSPTTGILTNANLVSDPLTWLPTTLFAGKSQFDVSARGDVLLGPVVNAFLLPQGLNNKIWYKTYFSTFSADAAVTVSSFGGDVTHRLAVTPTGGGAALPILSAWNNSQYLLSSNTAANFQPWLRVAETTVTNFATIFTLTVPTVRSTAFAGDVNIVGPMTLFPSPTGTLELAASGAVVGLQPTGRGLSLASQPVTVWTAATVNVSDANPDLVPSIGSPLAFSTLVGRDLQATQPSGAIYATVDPLFKETGSFSGAAATVEIQQALHAAGLLHAGDAEPVRIYALGGDVTGLTLFSPKATRIVAQNDITDVSFYIQNVAATDISFVSAGRDIVPFNANAALRSIASNLERGNLIGDAPRSTVTGVNTNAMQGDIQINGPGVLEVLAGRNLDLGTGPNFTDGTGTGITSVGNSRNPFLPLTGADIIASAGVSGAGGSGPAFGLAGSSLDFAAFIDKYLTGDASASAYLAKIEATGGFDGLTPEQRAVAAMEVFFKVLKDTGRAASEDGDYSEGFAAIDLLFGTTKPKGEITTRSRDIRTTSGGAISLLAPGGGLTLAKDIFGNPLTPPGIVTEFGGPISIFTDGSVDIGQARIFTLRGGDILMWASTGDIAAGSAPKTVVTAPPTRVLIDATSAAVQTDLGGLATGGGIGVLASVAGVMPGDVDLIAPGGTVDAGDAGIRVTGNLNIAATAVLNAGNIQAGGTSTGVPSTPVVAASSLGGLTAASNTAAAGANTAQEAAKQAQQQASQQEELPSIITVDLVGFEGGEEEPQ